MTEPNDLFHLVAFVALIASIVSLVITGHAGDPTVTAFIALLGAQTGFKIGEAKNATSKQP